MKRPEHYTPEEIEKRGVAVTPNGLILFRVNPYTADMPYTQITTPEGKDLGEFTRISTRFLVSRHIIRDVPTKINYDDPY